MSDEENNLEKLADRNRSEPEIKADLDQKKAETKRIQTETKKLLAEAKKAELELKEAEISYFNVHRKFQKERSVDEENHLYRYDGEISHGSVKTCMKKLTEWSRLDPGCDMEIVFSSPGGSIIDGFELFDFIQELRGRGHKITTGSLGMAASMAGILLMAGDVRWIGHQSWMMIHRAAFGAYGKTFEIEDEVKFVQRIEERILDVFTSRSKLSKLKIKRNWDRKDWWISADECLELNLIDEIRGMMPEMVNKDGEKK
jgi:ATP-dependent Clp protease protease subunit